MGEIIAVTADNVKLCEDALEALRRNVDELENLAKEYPLECSLGNYRFVFTNRGHVLSLIETLDRKVKAFHARPEI